MRFERALPAALSLLVIACAQGRTMGEPPRSDAATDDAPTYFPDAVLPDAPGLDAPFLVDAFAPSLDAASEIDAGASPDAARPLDAAMPDAARPVDAAMPDASRCPCTPGAPCATSCGSTGATSCASPCTPMCVAPSELCNVSDDDCDGACDEDVGGCRESVVRAYHDSLGGHLYTRDRSEIAAGGFRTEADPFFFVYPSAQPGLAAFHRCYLGRAHRLYTFDAGCEGSGASDEGILGYVAPSPVCGARPLYRLSASDDHFYTVDAGERDFAVSIGYTDEGIAAYVW
ncbi:MAG: hypothetical protein K1X94_13375 [Sandaracinaceae bacterium]|nr:hypothetical protein [Sandaracinaceae bacterium]